MEKNHSLTSARKAKNDEFYTQLTDIENELRHYKAHFKGKTVLCNCDDPEWSSFYDYFRKNFQHLGLKRLITTHYVRGGKSYALEIKEGDKPDILSTDPGRRIPLRGDGDFRSEEWVELLRQADIVVTNPPFSLFREYLRQLMEHDKRFLIIGNYNAISYKEVFQALMQGKLWVGVSPRSMTFSRPDGSLAQVNANWFTNLDHKKRHEEFISYRSYYDDPSHFPKYDNYDAIDVSKVKDIPDDYFGAMGVPINFLDKWNPDQFEIISCNEIRANNRVPVKDHGLIKDKDSAISGQPVYVRIVIRRKK